MADTKYKACDAHQREAERLRTNLYETETKAGIRGSDSPFMVPSGEVRRLYFTVKDKNLRKELISKHREHTMHVGGYTRARAIDEEQELRDLELKGFTPPWVLPSVVTSLTIYTGWTYALLPGALAGTVAGFFIGNAYIETKRNENRREIADARAVVDQLGDEQKKDESDCQNHPDFSQREEDSGGEDEGGQEPDIHWFARLGMAAQVQRQLEKGVSVESENNESWGSRPLHRAAANGNPDVVRVLLDAGANPNATNRLHGFTALHSAAAAGCTECVRMLVEAGASVDAKDRYGHVPQQVATMAGHADAVRAILAFKACQSTSRAD